jgi:N-acetylmuramoyl-L-alanine amidase
METLSIFIFKSIVVSAVFTAWYMLGLRGYRLHHYNRFFLLSSLLLSILIPFLHFHLIDFSSVESVRLTPVSLFIQQEISPDPGVSSTPAARFAQTNWQIILLMIMAALSLILLVKLAIRIIIIRRLCRQFPITHFGEINVVQTNLAKAPFAFFNYLFWNNSIQLDGEIGQLIFRHEATHILQRHTYDKLFCQLVTCLFWFNPFFWIIQKELNLVHEFIADEHAVKDRDTHVFAMMLLKSYNNGSHLVPQHHFFSSTIKRRLTMLQNIAEPSFVVFRRFMVLPLIAIVVLAFSCSTKQNANNVPEPAKRKIVVLVDPAHGGTDAGSQFDGLTEKDISLKFASRLKELSSSWNVEIQLTRVDDRNISLAGRAEQANKLNPDLFLSLHFNNEPGIEKAKGDFDIYVSAQSTHAAQSNSYSTAIFNALQQGNLLPAVAACNHGPDETCENCRNNSNNNSVPKIVPADRDDIYLLRNSKVPSLVMILGNIKNRERMKQFTDGNMLDIICNTILSGIANGANRQGTPDINDPAFLKTNNSFFSAKAEKAPAGPTCSGNNMAAVQISINRSQ